MIVSQITTFFHPVTGGVETQVIEISQKMVALGHKVEVLTTDSDRVGGRVTNLRDKFENIGVKRAKVWFSISKFHKFVPGFIKNIWQSDADVFHVHGFPKFEGYIALLIAKLKGKKVVVTAHNRFTTVGRASFLDKLMKIHDKTFGKITAKLFDGFIALLEQEKEVLVNNFGIDPNKIKVIPNGISDIFYVERNNNRENLTDFINEKYNLKIPKNFDQIVLSVGRLNKIKGIQNLEKAVLKNQDTLFLILGGDDGHFAKLENQYKDYSNVYIQNCYVDFNDMPKLYQIADTFVLPSLHEPFGLTPVEAVASGVPVIATTKGGPKDVLSKDFAIFIDPDNQLKWASEIKSLLNDKNRREKMVHLGKEYSKKYMWKNVIPQIESFYLSVIDNGRKT